MYMFTTYFFVFLLQCSEASYSSGAVVFEKKYLDPKSFDHRKTSGRWYEHMDTLDNTVRENLFADVVVVCGRRIQSVQILNRWIPALEECRTKAVVFQPNTSDSPEGVSIRMSTKDTVGKMTFRYFDPHPTNGFAVLHRQSLHLPDSYFISCRQKDPSNIDKVIKQVLVALHLDIGDFNVKSKDFGCEKREEKGIEL